MNHTQLLNAAKASTIPLPGPSHEKYDLIVRAQANAELMRREAKRKAEKDLYHFCTSVLGYAEMYEPLHRPLCEFVTSSERTSLTLIPRGHFKSTVISVSYPLWLLAKYPDTRILLANAVLPNPRKWVSEMETHLKANMVLRWIYPEMCPAEDEVQQFGYPIEGESVKQIVRFKYVFDAGDSASDGIHFIAQAPAGHHRGLQGVAARSTRRRQDGRP